MFRSDITIVGGGVAAYLAALIAVKQGLKTVLLQEYVSATAVATDDHRVFALTQTAWENLLRWGVVSHSQPEDILLDNMHLYFSHEARSSIVEDPYVISAWEAKLPYLAHLYPHRLLKQACLKSVGQHMDLIKVFAKPGTLSPIKVENGWQLFFTKQQDEQQGAYQNLEKVMLETKCLVVAEGSRSTLREQLGLEASWGSYSQFAMVANFITEKPHHGVASQWFLSDALNTGDVVALLPTHFADNEAGRVSLVWSSVQHDSQHLADETFDWANYLEMTLGDSVTKTYGKLILCTKPEVFPLWRLTTEQRTTHHALLLGDCASSVHPLAGMGFNLVMSDLMVWEDCLKRLQKDVPEISGGFSISASADRLSELGRGKMLARYQRLAKAQRWPIETMIDGIFGLTRPQYRPFTRWLMKGVKHIPASFMAKRFARLTRPLFQ
jgi:2-polyprenyl-6-methoxyphenol hydroxylase-like FAD-dependent oxidoreductase